MINITPIIGNKLKTVCDNVSGSYPKKWEKFPIVIFTEEDNKTVTSDGKEFVAYIRYRIDIYNTKSCSDIAIKIDEVMESMGLTRSFCSNAPDPNYQHKVMRYEGRLDVRNIHDGICRVL